MIKLYEEVMKIKEELESKGITPESITANLGERSPEDLQMDKIERMTMARQMMYVAASEECEKIEDASFLANMYPALWEKMENEMMEINDIVITLSTVISHEIIKKYMESEKETPVTPVDERPIQDEKEKSEGRLFINPLPEMPKQESPLSHINMEAEEFVPVGFMYTIDGVEPDENGARTSVLDVDATVKETINKMEMIPDEMKEEAIEHIIKDGSFESIAKLIDSRESGNGNFNDLISLSATLTAAAPQFAMDSRLAQEFITVLFGDCPDELVDLINNIASNIRGVLPQ